MFTKRIVKDGIETSKFYTDSSINPFAISSVYNMPNCTCYAYGRASEILGKKADGLCLKNGKNWYNNSTGFDKGTEPRLGAIMCFDGTYGHVSVVEEIKENGDIVCSNSNWGNLKHGDDGKYFFTTTHTKESGYNNYDKNLKFQGFIYIYTGSDSIPVFETKSTTKYLNLSDLADTWRVYPMNVAPVVGNECKVLKPSKFGGLSYTLLGYTQSNVAIINTRDFGQVQIYIGNDVSNMFTITNEPMFGLVN